tara:strand:- start:2414 stop:2779 length:366 start_codon:yes stop_codon:yes gene_type:complete
MPLKKKSESKQTKAGLIFPISRVNRMMKEVSGIKRIGGSASVYMTAVKEYVTSEILELAGKQTHVAKRKRVTDEDVILGIRSDAELAKLCNNVAVYTGDKLSGVSNVLKPSSVKDKKKTPT